MPFRKGTDVVPTRTSSANSALRQQVVASGGTETTITVGAQKYRVHSFTSSSTLTVTAPGFVDVLVVGGGGPSNGGYAGAGGSVLEMNNYYLAAGSYAVTVGSGGAATPSLGGKSEFNGKIALMGSYVNWDTSNLKPIGCAAGTNGGLAIQGYGGTGGTGAGGAGGAASGSTSGVGVTSSITGSAVEYGFGGKSSTSPSANTGGGGKASAGEAGAAGIVIVRYPI